MCSDVPKPYLLLGDRYLIDVTLERLLGVSQIAGVYVALHAEDRWWKGTASAASKLVSPYRGGPERADSVRAGLDRIRDEALADDWVLVHDVARPCVRATDIETLLTTLSEDPVGGLLAAPLSDTVKRVADDSRVDGTADRTRLWRALTPQVFRFGLLDRALQQALVSDIRVTDEASAIEALGYRPRIIRGRPDNIKVTVPEDLALAAWFLGIHQ